MFGLSRVHLLDQYIDPVGVKTLPVLSRAVGKVDNHDRNTHVSELKNSLTGACVVVHIMGGELYTLVAEALLRGPTSPALGVRLREDRYS